VAVILSQVLAQIGQVKATINTPEQVFLGNNRLKVEGVEQMVLTAWLTPHHLDYPAQNMR